LGILVDKVGHERVVLAADRLLARRVEVKLQQSVAVIGDADRAAGRQIHLDGVAIVDDAQWTYLILKIDGRKLGLLSRGDVDGCLPFAGATGLELWLQAGPLRRTMLLAISPVGLLGARGRDDHEREQQGSNGGLCAERHAFLPRSCLAFSPR